MRQSITLLFFIVLFANTAVGQAKLGLKFSPAISTNHRAEVISDTLSIDRNSSKFKFSLGLIVDLPISERYFFSTGAIILPKTASVSIRAENGGSYPNATEEYNLQYIQLPATLKLFTNEVAPDLTVYFQIGGAFEIRVDDRPIQDTNRLVQTFNPLDISGIIGAGAEYRLGINTTGFAGFSFQRGLINVVKTPINPDLDLTVKSTFISLDLGIKF